MIPTMTTDLRFWCMYLFPPTKCNLFGPWILSSSARVVTKSLGVPIMGKSTLGKLECRGFLHQPESPISAALPLAH